MTQKRPRSSTRDGAVTETVSGVIARHRSAVASGGAITAPEKCASTRARPWAVSDQPFPKGADNVSYVKLIPSGPLPRPDGRVRVVAIVDTPSGDCAEPVGSEGSTPFRDLDGRHGQRCRYWPRAATRSCPRAWSRSRSRRPVRAPPADQRWVPVRRATPRFAMTCLVPAPHRGGARSAALPGDAEGRPVGGECRRLRHHAVVACHHRDQLI